MYGEMKKVMAVLTTVAFVSAIEFADLWRPHAYGDLRIHSLIVAGIGICFACIPLRLYLKFRNPYFVFIIAVVSIALLPDLPIMLTDPQYITPLGMSLISCFSWLSLTLPVCFLVYASILYRESWEGERQTSRFKEFMVLVPYSRNYKFWVALAGVALIIKVTIMLTTVRYFHITNTILLYIVIRSSVMVAQIVLSIIYLSLFRIYKTKFFKCLFVASLLPFALALLTLASLLYFHLTAPSFPYTNYSWDLVVTTVYYAIISALIVYAFVTYRESPGKNSDESSSSFKPC